MVTKGIGVKSWELVVKTDPRTGKFKGKMPSDHHPLMAVLKLPAPAVPEPEPAARGFGPAMPGSPIFLLRSCV